MIASSSVASREVSAGALSREDQCLVSAPCTPMVRGGGARAARPLAASTQAQALHGPDESITED